MRLLTIVKSQEKKTSKITETKTSLSDVRGWERNCVRIGPFGSADADEGAPFVAVQGSFAFCWVRPVELTAPLTHLTLVRMAGSRLGAASEFFSGLLNS